MVQKYTDKEEQKCNRCGKKYTCQTFQCNTNSSKGQAKTLATYEDITSNEDAIFVEQQNTTSVKQDHVVDLSLFCLNYFHEDLSI